ncbi:MAG TPA: tetratricopeptide repeat protein, partial [Gemmataceae bacterium]|nr:tetratricopeptide repeat protein [Gemmataceae bacterium]
RLSTTEETPSIAARRGLEPKRLTGLLRGELDWIVMKALEKDRNRRYDTANAFAADVQRYLADEPVLACPPSAGYRLRKFVRRHRGRLAIAAGACVLVAAVLGSIGWAVRDRAVREGEKQREQAARQARASNDLELALDRAELFQGQGKRAEALAALGRAEFFAGEAPADPARTERLAAVKERLAAEARDQEFVARFEDVRLRLQSQIDLEKSAFTDKEAFPAIQEALRRHGVAIGGMPPAQAAAYIRGRPEQVRRDLIAALDECLRWAPQGEAQARAWLLATLDAADKDVWRIRARKALAHADWQVLEQMACEADVRKQPPSILVAAAIKLPEQMRATRLELLRRTQRAYPADLWANHALAMELLGDGHPAEAVRYFTAALALRPENPGIYLNRSGALKQAGEVDAAIADCWQSLTLAPQYAVAHYNLGIALNAQGRRDEAIAEFREALRINKDYAQAHVNLGNALQDKGRLDEAIAEFRAAVATKQGFSEAYKAHHNLGIALNAQGRLDEAIAEYREAIGLRKDYPEAHYNLGVALYAKGRLGEATAEFREAVRLQNDLAEAHNSLGVALTDKGQLDDAISECREAIRLKKDYPQAHYNLGNALRKKGQLHEAMAEYREAIRLQKDYPEAHCNLGLALWRQGEFRKALEELRRGHGLGSKDPRWRYPSAQWVRQCERLVQLDEQLPGFLDGKTAPAGPAEQIELAGLCSLKHLHRAAARFYGEALTAEPKLADDLRAFHRYNAARAAALAGVGKGPDARDLDDQGRARLRQQALDWLRADLAACGRVLGNGPEKARPLALRRLRDGLADPDFAGVRESEALARLPERERQAWLQLWADVRDRLARAQRPTTPKKESATK